MGSKLGLGTEGTLCKSEPFCIKGVRDRFQLINVLPKNNVLVLAQAGGEFDPMM